MRELREENEKLRKVFEAMQGVLVNIAFDLCSGINRVV